MKILPKEKDGFSATIVSGGHSQAVVVSVIHKHTWKGTHPFIRCRIPDGEDEGREVDFVAPKGTPSGSSFHRFLESVLDSAEIGEDVAPERLIGEPCGINVRYSPEWGGATLHIEPCSVVEKMREIEGREQTASV